jgi:L-asparagine oxygenase
MKKYHNIYTINSSQSTNISEELLDIVSPYDNYEKYIWQVNRCIGLLPEEIYRAIKYFGEASGYPGHIIINSDVKDPILPDTPSFGSPPKNKSTFVSEAYIGIISAVLGQMIAYVGENEGSLIQQVVPVASFTSLESNNGSHERLRLHCENIFSIGFYPQYLVLHCIRGDSGATTIWFEVDDLIKSIPDDLLNTLYQPIFRFPVPKSFGGVIPSLNNSFYSDASPILLGSADYPEMRIDFTGMISDSEVGKDAINELDKLINSNEICYSITLEPGQTLILNNRTTAHGRSSYSPEFDNLKSLRWLQRTFLHKDPWSGRRGLTANARVYIPVLTNKQHIR